MSRIAVHTVLCPKEGSGSVPVPLLRQATNVHLCVCYVCHACTRVCLVLLLVLLVRPATHTICHAVQFPPSWFNATVIPVPL